MYVNDDRLFRRPAIGPFENKFAQNSRFLILFALFLFYPTTPPSHTPTYSFFCTFNHKNKYAKISQVFYLERLSKVIQATIFAIIVGRKINLISFFSFCLSRFSVTQMLE